jgi:Holliday junction DNA helicase RuvB
MHDHSLDVGDITPTSLSHLIGQQSVIGQVAVALEAAFADSKKFDDALLVGGPGLGKTQLAKGIAAELASNFHEVLGQTVENSADLNAVLLSSKDKDVVFIDEAHELPKEHQTALYLALDQRRICLSGSKSGRTPQSIPIANFTVLLATTDEYCLLQPLRDRMKLVLRFQFYSEDELAILVKQRCLALQWAVEESIFPFIAQRSRGTPRLALRLLQACRRVARAEGQMTITLAHLDRACILEQIDALGLGPTEQQYLAALASGASRLNVLASLLGLPVRTVSQVTEPFLIRAGLFVKDDQGRRQLTPKGWEHLSRTSPFRGQNRS